MEANFFRFLADELGDALIGRRIDKVFGPAPGVWVLKIQNTGEPLHLIYRPAKTAGHLFLSASKPANPQNAPAMAMWFRKRLRNRKILSCHVDWPTLRLALGLTPRDEDGAGNYLLIDCRKDMSLIDELETNFGSQPEWPALEDVLNDNEIWREYPHISPPLRKVLTRLSEDQALDLYFKVATAQATSFFITKGKTGPTPPMAWATGDSDEAFDSALTAANVYGERTLFPLLEMEDDKPNKDLLKRARKKVRRNLTRLDEEEQRLGELAAEKRKAEALQMELYRFKEEQDLEQVTVNHPEYGEMTVELNPFLTPTENMERYFKRAAKAQRGFSHIERRRKEMLKELERIEDGTYEIHPALKQQTTTAPQGPPSLPKKFRGLAVSIFRSDDGFTIIRGKNKAANHKILSQAASPFDYWFHVEDGPSSHVILKRDHPNQEVPETTLHQAAILCGLKSYRKDDGKADIMYALVKDVRKVKGYALGQVAVDHKLGTVRIDLDGTLEKRLTL